MVNLDFANDQSPILLTVRGASQATGGMLTERRIWQLVKSKQLATIKDENGKIVIPFEEFRRFLNDENAVLAA